MGFRSKSELCEVLQAPDVATSRSLPPGMGVGHRQATFGNGLNKFLWIRATGLSSTQAQERRERHGLYPTPVNEYGVIAPIGGIPPLRLTCWAATVGVYYPNSRPTGLTYVVYDEVT